MTYILPALSSKLLQAGQFQCLLCGYSLGRVELEHAQDQVFDILITVSNIAFQTPLFYFDLVDYCLGTWTIKRIHAISGRHSCELYDLL